jgi:hypothetical protein
MATYRITRNAPGRIQLVIAHPEWSNTQTFETSDLGECLARDIAKLRNTQAVWDPPQGDGARNRLYVTIGGGTIVSNSSNLTATPA